MEEVVLAQHATAQKTGLAYNSLWSQEGCALGIRACASANVVCADIDSIGVAGE